MSNTDSTKNWELTQFRKGKQFLFFARHPLTAPKSAIIKLPKMAFHYFCFHFELYSRYFYKIFGSCGTVFLLCVFTFWVPCCDVRIETFVFTFCRRAHVLFTLFVFVYVICFCLRIVLSICCVFLHLVNPMLLVSLDCPFFFIDPSVFSNFYFV
jgi:hypothetical protein